MVTPDQEAVLDAKRVALAEALGLPTTTAWSDLLVEAGKRQTPRAGVTRERADAAAMLLQRVTGRVEDALTKHMGAPADAAIIHETLLFVALLQVKGFTEDEALAALGLQEASASAPAPSGLVTRPAKPEKRDDAAEFRRRGPMGRAAEALRRQEETRRAAMNFKRAEALAAMLEPEEEGANTET